MNWKNRDWAWIYWSAVVLLLITGYIVWDNMVPEWGDYQADFKELVAKRFGQARAKQVPAGIQQVWVPQLGRADRCTTCHMGVSWKGFENAPEPFRTHSTEILAKHPIAPAGGGESPHRFPYDAGRDTRVQGQGHGALMYGGGCSVTAR